MKAKLGPSLKFSTFFLGPALFALIVSVVMFIYTYRQMQEFLIKTLSDQNIYFAEQVSATTEFADDVLLDIANQIFYDSQVSVLRESSNITNTQMIDGMRKIDSITATNTIIDSIYVYNGNLDYVFSTLQYGAVNDNADNFKDVGAVELFRSRLQENRLVLIPRKTYMTKDSDKANTYSFLYFENLPNNITGNNALILNLRPTTFSKLYIGSSEDTKSFIINDKGTLISDRKNISEQSLYMIISRVLQEVEEGNKSGNLSFIDENKEESVCFFACMGDHNWIHIKTLTNSEIFGDVISSKKVILAILASAIILLLMMFVFVTQSVYIPFIKITKRFSHEKNPNQVFRDLDTLITKSSDNERMSEQLNESILKKILTGECKYDDSKLEIEKCHLKLVPGFPIWLYLISVPSLEHETVLIQETIPFNEIVSFEMKYFILILQPTAKQQIEDLSKKLIEKYPSSYHIISPEIKDWHNITENYDYLNEQWLLRFQTPDTKYISLSAINERSRSISSLSEKSANIISILKKGAFSKLNSAYEDFINELNGKCYFTVRLSLINLGNAIIKLENDNAIVDSTELENNQLLSVIDNLDDIETANAYFRVKFNKIAELQQKKISSNQTRSIHDIMEFIENNYTDFQLSTTSIADHFGMSAQYIARKFKQYTGISIQNYINNIRVERSKELLCKKGIRINEVAEAVGIQNRQYFFKLFKTITGKTPSHYRADNMKESETAKN